MKALLMIVTGTALACTGVAAATQISAASESSTRATRAELAGPPRLQTQYGHIRSLTRRGSRFELRFDPAWWLSGATANRAAVEDKVIQPGETVPNDYYIRDETKRLLTYIVPTSARVTVITNPQVKGLRITVSELAQILKGKNPSWPTSVSKRPDWRSPGSGVTIS